MTEAQAYRLTADSPKTETPPDTPPAVPTTLPFAPLELSQGGAVPRLEANPRGESVMLRQVYTCRIRSTAATTQGGTWADTSPPSRMTSLVMVLESVTLWAAAGSNTVSMPDRE